MVSSKQRTEAYKQVMIKKRIKIDMSLVESTDLTSANTTVVIKKLLELKLSPTAILAINDYVALDAIHYIKSLKPEVNKNICFVSYANLPITSFLQHPPLASVEQYPYKQGKTAAEILINVLNTDKNKAEVFHNILIDGELIIHTNEA